MGERVGFFGGAVVGFPVGFDKRALHAVTKAQQLCPGSSHSMLLPLGHG